MRKESNLSFITWLRASSAILILLCHYCARCEYPLISVLSMVFNIGVQLFFIMSGFLVGYKGITKPYSKWYRKRLNRIFIPFWMFLFVLAIVHAANNISLLSVDWLFLVFGLQGTVVNVWGAEQTWFISVLLLCYLLSPLILDLTQRVSASHNSWIRAISIMAVCIMPIAYAFFEAPWVYTVFTPVSLYIMSCVYGVNYNPEKRFTHKKTLLALFVVAVSFCMRFAAKLFCDGTILYDRIVVPYSQTFAAYAIVYIFEAIFNTRTIPPLVQFISNISFEIYLYHYMFVQGPIALFGYFSNWVVGCIVVTSLVLPLSFVANRISTAISSKQYTRL